MSKPEADLQITQHESAGIFASLPHISALKNNNTQRKAQDLMEEANFLRESIEPLSDRFREILDELQNIQTRNHLDGLRCGLTAFRYTETKGRRTLNRDLLIENGVPPKVIESSYKVGEPGTKREFKLLKADE